MDSHKIGILLPDPAQGNNPAIWVGQPGGEPFTPGTALPTSDSFVPEQITRDAYNGDITAVGYGSDGTNEGVYVTTLGRFASTWTTPTLVATLHSPTSDYVIQALSTYQGSKYVGLLRPLGAVSHPKASLFVVHGNKSGQFTGVIALPHSTVQDTELRLATNPETGHLHAAFTRQVPSSKTKRSGILQEARGDNGWNKPTVYTHWYRDFADQITFNVVGKAVIGYDQR
jgi:hypothetical protein